MTKIDPKQIQNRRGADQRGRRARNRAPAAQGEANRCWLCKRSFLERGMIIEDFFAPGKQFCSTACVEQGRVEHWERR